MHRQVEVLNNDTYTASTRLLQMQRRITELESRVGIPPKKFWWSILTAQMRPISSTLLRSIISALPPLKMSYQELLSLSN